MAFCAHARSVFGPGLSGGRNSVRPGYVIEPSAGLTRSLMAFLVEAYTEDEAPNTKGGVDKRIVLRLDPRIAPVKAAVLPLSRKEELTGSMT